MRDDVVVCPDCDGYGYEVGHEDECYERGDCVCSGVQLPCRTCGGSGNTKAPDLSEAFVDVDEVELLRVGGSFRGGSGCRCLTGRRGLAARRLRLPAVRGSRGLGDPESRADLLRVLGSQLGRDRSGRRAEPGLVLQHLPAVLRRASLHDLARTLERLRHGVELLLVLRGERLPLGEPATAAVPRLRLRGGTAPPRAGLSFGHLVASFRVADEPTLGWIPREVQGYAS